MAHITLKEDNNIMYYIGKLKDSPDVHVFYSDRTPQRVEYGHVYAYVTGGYRLKREALQAGAQTAYGKVTFINCRKITLDK